MLHAEFTSSILFELDEDQEATLSFYDVAGRLLVAETKNFSKGNNEYLFDATTYNITGLIYVKLQTAQNNYLRKMIITK